MITSKARSVREYLDELAPERRREIAEVRRVVRDSLPKGYRETINWGMICYELPKDTYPDTYNGQPLCYAGLAAQKNYNALYLTMAYADPKQGSRLREAFAKAGKKLDMGKSCVRFRKAEDLELGAIARLVGSCKPKDFVAKYEAARKREWR